MSQDTSTQLPPQAAWGLSQRFTSAAPNHGLGVKRQPSTSVLVSYPSSTYEALTKRQRITGAFPLIVDHGDKAPTLFNVDLPQCPNPKRMRVIDDATGEIDYVPYTWRDHQAGKERINRCCKNSCPVCVVLNGQRIAGAIMLAQPSWWFCLTLVGDSAPVIHKRVATFIHHSRREIPSLQGCWAAEENPEQTGCHVHGYLHAALDERRICRDSLEDAVRRAGVGRHWEIDTVHDQSGVEYFGYPMKSLVGGDYMAERFIELNGSAERRRLIHSSCGFWRDGEGGPSLTRSQAEVIAFQRSKMHGRDEPTHHQLACDYV